MFNNKTFIHLITDNRISTDRNANVVHILTIVMLLTGEYIVWLGANMNKSDYN